MRILSISGFVPEQICDTIRFTGYNGERSISHYCGYANDFISQVIMDNEIDGAVFPKSCDSSRIIKNYLDKCNKFLYQLVVPSRTDDMAVEFFSKELLNYKESIEMYFQTEINNIEDRINMINIRNKRISDVYHRLEEVSYGVYLRTIHECLKKPLCKQEFSLDFDKKNKGTKKVYLIGSLLANEKIADIIEDSGMSIVGDDLPESGRLKENIIDIKDKNIYTTISRHILKQKMSPTQNNFKNIICGDMDEIKKLGVDAVIFVMQKYCEPYEYLYSVFKKYLDDAKIKSLKISVSDSEDDRKVRLLVEAFADTI